MTTPYGQSPYGQFPYSPGQFVPRVNRSPIPKVIGILMIIFASLAMLANLVGLANSSNPALDHLEAWRTFERVSVIMGLIQLPISVFQLVTGIWLVKYKAGAPKLALIYGLLAAVHTIANAVIVFGFVKPALEAAMKGLGGMNGMMSNVIGASVVFGSIIGLAWPIVILTLTSRPSAKAACVN